MVILGSGPNRIGQGIEFDYCCCHAAFALREEGVETVMVNCNPETVSTDYDTADRLYFEPLTLEDVMAIIERERQGGGKVSCLVQFGGQTPLKLRWRCTRPACRSSAPRPTRSTWPRTASGSRRCSAGSTSTSRPAGPRRRATRRARWPPPIGFPVVVRPSYVLGGRGMAIVYEQAALDRYMRGAVDASPEHPVLIDRFLEDAFELDVDAVADATGAVVIGGIMEHIEEAGIHSGDSSCVLPTFLVAERHLETIRDWTRRIARALGVVGLMNIQFAIKDDVVYVLEVNPRASRTVPFLSKATGVPLAKAAARVMLGPHAGRHRPDRRRSRCSGVFVKAPVFPFVRFQGVDILLGPEMKSTGEAMGCGTSFGVAFAKAQASAGQTLPDSGHAFISVNDHDKPTVLPVARDLAGARLHARRHARHGGLPRRARPARRRWSTR